MEKIKELTDNLELMTMSIRDLVKHADKIHDAYEAVNNRYKSIEEKLFGADSMLKNMNETADILEKNVAKLNALNNSFQLFVKSSSTVTERLKSLGSFNEKNMSQINTQLQVLTGQSNKYFEEVQKTNDKLVAVIKTAENQNKINEQIKSITKDLSSLKELKNTSDNIMNVSELITKLYPMLNELKDYIAKNSLKVNEIAEIKELIIGAKGDIINAVSSRPNTTESPKQPKPSNQSKPIKSSPAKKKTLPNGSAAMDSILEQIITFDLEVDEDLKDAIRLFLENANELQHKDMNVYVCEESELNVKKDGRNDRRKWTSSYYANIEEILIPKNSNSQIKFTGKNIKKNEAVDARTISIKELEDFCLK
ncbi:MAG: hypothetical protein GXZ18_06265 [Synergistaceae bacterium]|nr:hypothetical protein [Synergistaceae bacterium]